MAVMSKQAIHPQTRTIDGVSIRFAEREPREEHALLTSPWPESLYAYEAMWSRLADEYAALVTAWWGGGYAAVERRTS
jgi:hypothetical protein